MERSVKRSWIQERTSRLSLKARKTLWGYFFVSPWIIGLLAFSVIPLLCVFYFSLTKYSVLEPPKFIGLANYEEMIHDELFWKSLYNTAYYVFFRLPLWLIVGLGLAMLLNRKERAIRIYRTGFYLPTIIPLVASSMLWLWLLNPQVGLINLTLRQFGIVAPNWLHDEKWAKMVIIWMGVWQVGQTMMIFLAGLQEIPEHLYEAAEIDGASGWQKLLRITLPMMTPTIFFNAVTGIISAFQVFGSAFIMTGGGPVNATLFFVLYLYRRAFQFLEMGFASGMAVVLFFIVLVLTALLFRSSKSWVHYERI